MRKYEESPVRSTINEIFQVVLFGGVLGLILSIIAVLILATVTKWITGGKRKELRQAIASNACKWLTATFIIFQLVMHFRMKHMLEPTWQAFDASATSDPDTGEVKVSYETLRERSRILADHGYKKIGWWRAKACRISLTPCTQRSIIYLYIPFL